MSRHRITQPYGPPQEFLDSDWLWSHLPQIDRSKGPGADRYRGIVRETVSRMKLMERSEWNDYGSGLASFFDVWVYRDEPAFRRPRYDKADHSFAGLWVLMCRLAPCCVMGEGEKSWSATNGSGYVPTFSGVDRFATKEVAELAGCVTKHLSTHGLVRLYKGDLAPLLPADCAFKTNLGDGPLRIFDALFFWND